MKLLKQRRCAVESFSASLIGWSAADVGLDLVQLGYAMGLHEV